jgi:vancomycin permeability regulator SanA
MNIRYSKRYKWIFLTLTSIGIVVIVGPTLYANLATRSIRFDLKHSDISSIPSRDVAIVFGTQVYPDGQPSQYLKWRVDAAVKLYQSHKVKKLLMTGDNSTRHYNEPVAMQKYAMSLGVPVENIVLDYAGFSTYDSCYRAHAIFKVTNAILVSQGFHLPRAILTCRAFGLQVIGVDGVYTGKGQMTKAREWLSTDKMVLELVLKPKPLLGPIEPIKV